MNPLAYLNPSTLVPENIPGWCHDFAQLYADMVELAPVTGAHFVEVGSWLGKSAVTLARLIAASGKPIRLSCVDTFRGSASDAECFADALAQHGGDVRKAFDANLERHGVRGCVEVVQLPSVEAAAQFADASLDFVFLDADHAYEAVLADIRAWLPKLAPSGILGGHDWGYLGVAAAVRECLPADEVLLAAPLHTSWLWQKPGA